MEGLSLIDPARGRLINELVLANPNGVLICLTLGENPELRALERFLPSASALLQLSFLSDSSSFERTGSLPTRSTWPELAGLSEA